MSEYILLNYKSKKYNKAVLRYTILTKINFLQACLDRESYLPARKELEKRLEYYRNQLNNLR